MQSGERLETAEKNQGQPVFPQAARAKTSDEVVDQLAQIAALGSSVTQAYAGQLKLAGQIASAEWQLTGRSLTIAATLVVCFGAGLILLWGSIVLLLGYLLFQLSSSAGITAAALLLLQFAMLLWCWRCLNHVLSQAGFSNTWRQLRLLFFKPQMEGDDADPTSTEKTAA